MQGNRRTRKMNKSSGRSQDQKPVRLNRDDIIMGRGNQFSTHPGNVRFYATIDQYTAAYFASQTKFDKSRVVQQVFKILSTTGRFLRMESATRNFYKISDTDARQKISHAIRYRFQNGGSGTESTGRTSPESSQSPTLVTVSRELSSPAGPSEGVGFFDHDQRLSPFLQFIQPPQAQQASQQQSCANPQTVAPVKIELFSDEEILSVLGDPSEYFDGDEVEVEVEEFTWPDPVNLSPLHFRAINDENDLPAGLSIVAEEEDVGLSEWSQKVHSAPTYNDWQCLFDQI